MSKWIKDHQLISFSIVAIILSWGLMAPFMLGNEGDIYEVLGLVGLFGPALATLLVSRWVSPPPQESTPKKWISFVIIWILATVSFTLYVQLSSPIETPFAIIIYALFAIFPAIIWSSAFSKFPEVKKNLSSLVKPQGNIGFYLLALLLAPLIKIISIPINAHFDWITFSVPQNFASPSSLISFTLISFAYTFLFAGGINEEVGWTGFLLPKLQQKFSPLVSSILVWFGWIVWHLPMHYAGVWNAATEDFIRALVGTFFARFIFTWLYNKTKGSILSAIVFHTSANVSFMILPATLTQMILEAGIAIGLVVSGKMWAKLPAGSNLSPKKNCDM